MIKKIVTSIVLTIKTSLTEHAVSVEPDHNDNLTENDRNSERLNNVMQMLTSVSKITLEAIEIVGGLQRFNRTLLATCILKFIHFGKHISARDEFGGSVDATVCREKVLSVI